MPLRPLPWGSVEGVPSGDQVLEGGGASSPLRPGECPRTVLKPNTGCRTLPWSPSLLALRPSVLPSGTATAPAGCERRFSSRWRCCLSEVWAGRGGAGRAGPHLKGREVIICSPLPGERTLRSSTQRRRGRHGDQMESSYPSRHGQCPRATCCHTHTCVHTCMYTHMYTLTHTHTHTHPGQSPVLAQDRGARPPP